MQDLMPWSPRSFAALRMTFPVLLGTVVSQTVLNLVALVLLGVVIVSTTPLFHSSTQALFAFRQTCNRWRGSPRIRSLIPAF